MTDQVTADAMTLLAAIVRMMGGSVTVSAADLEAAARCELTNYMNQDPPALVIIVKEPDE